MFHIFFCAQKGTNILFFELQNSLENILAPKVFQILYESKSGQHFAHYAKEMEATQLSDFKTSH